MAKFFVVLLSLLGLPLSVMAQQAPTAGSDTYLIENSQYVNAHFNDTNYTGYQMIIWTPPLPPSGVQINNWDPFACKTCPYITPGTGFTGVNSFEYKYVACCGNTGPDSNVATVIFGVIPGDDKQNAGRGCRAPSIGRPINVTNGNMWLEQRDYFLPGRGELIEINRFYNSIIQTSGLFGLGWSTKYDESLQFYGDRMIRFNQPDGRAIYFGRLSTSDPFYSFSPDVVGQITANIDGTFSLTFKDGRSRRFSSAGRLLSQKDASNNETLLSYNASGHLTSVTDPVGRVLTLTPNTNGTIAQMSDSLGIVADYEYFSGTTHLKTVTYPDGSKYKFEYATVGSKTLIATVRDALDNVLETHAYDAQGRATTSEIDGAQESYTLNYTVDALNNPLTIVTDGLGRQTKYWYARYFGTNVVTKTEGICGCGGGGSEVTTYEYDVGNSWLNLKKKTDALNRQTLYTYDNDRNVVQLEEKLGSTTLGIQKWTYNSRGQVLTYKDRVDQNTTDDTVVNTYDSNGNPLTTTDRLGHTTTMTYTSNGQLETVTDARSMTTTLTYDAQSRLIEVTDANNKDTTFGYDARARVASVTNAKNESTAFTYDLNNRLKRVTFPDANYTENTYDLAGRRTQFRNPRGNVTTFAYDSAYRLTSVTDPLNHTKTFGYDAMSNLTSQTDALGNTTNFEYDDFDRLKKIIYPPATTGATRLEESVTYDKLGNVKTRVDTAGRTTAYDYDDLNRLLKITDALTNQTHFEYNLRSQMTKVKDALNQEYVFTYDPLGRVLTQTRAGTTMTFEYDPVGNRTKRTDHNGSVTNYTYDNLNRLTSGSLGTYTYDDVSQMLTATNYYGTVSFTYDNRGRVDTTTDVYGKVVDYDYDPNGNRTLMKLDGVNFSGYVFDAADRLTSQTSYLTGSPANITFVYDDADRLTARLYPYSQSSSNQVYTTFAYDGMSRLTRMTDQKRRTILLDKQYSYNTANQISEISEPARLRTFTYDAVDRLTAATDTVKGNESYTYDAVGNRTASHLSSSYTYNPFNRLTGTQNETYTYDNNGSMTSRTDANETMTFVHDSDGRMVASYTDILDQDEYRYDALGRRIYVRKPYQVPIEYTFDGHDVMLTSLGGSLTKFQNGPGIDNKLGSRSGTLTPSYYLSDHLGTTTATVTPLGGFNTRPALDSFGNVEGDFTGREYDTFNDLYYYRARMYDPKLGRFISEDPIGFDGGDINLYGYVWNSPIVLRDPLGRTGEVTNQPASWSRTPQQQEHIDRALNQPEFQRPENLNRRTANSWWGWFQARSWFDFKTFFGDVPTACVLGRYPQGFTKAGAMPGFGEAVNLLEGGPQIYDTVDLIGRKKHDERDIINCIQTGVCQHTEYRSFGGPPSPRTYEDLSYYERVACTVRGNCPPSMNR